MNKLIRGAYILFYSLASLASLAVTGWMLEQPDPMKGFAVLPLIMFVWAVIDLVLVSADL
jgi:hypothetical protein